MIIYLRFGLYKYSNRPNPNVIIVFGVILMQMSSHFSSFFFSPFYLKSMKYKTCNQLEKLLQQWISSLIFLSSNDAHSSIHPHNTENEQSEDDEENQNESTIIDLYFHANRNVYIFVIFRREASSIDDQKPIHVLDTNGNFHLFASRRKSKLTVIRHSSFGISNEKKKHAQNETRNCSLTHDGIKRKERQLSGKNKFNSITRTIQK